MFFWDEDELEAHTSYLNQQNRLKRVDEKYKKKGILWYPESYSKAYYLLAYMAVEEKDWAKGLEYINRGIELEDDHPLLLSEKALILGQMGKHKKSYKMYMKSLSCRPWALPKWRARAFRGAGIALTEMNRLDEAENMFKKSLELEPDNKTAKDELVYVQMLRSGLKVSRKRTLTHVLIQSQSD